MSPTADREKQHIKIESMISFANRLARRSRCYRPCMRLFSALALGVALAACSTTETPPATVGDASVLPEASSDVAVALDSAPDAPPDVVARVLALTASCGTKIGGDYKAKTGSAWPANIGICQLKGAVFFNADMDIDCDGLQTTTCNLQTDPAFQPNTSATDSKGKFLDAAIVPYVVLPLPSGLWDSTQFGIQLGSVVLVIYKGKMAFGVYADEGPPTIIGESSVAMAKLLGIDPDPKTGGVDTGVTYVVFTGPTGVVTKNEDHAEATTVGTARLTDLLKNN